MPITEQTAFVWHAYVPGVQPGQRSATGGTGEYAPERGLRFNPNVVLLDPYAKAVEGTEQFDQGVFAYVPGDEDNTLQTEDQRGAPLGLVVDPGFDWQGDQPPRVPFHQSVIYEAHVRGPTMTPPTCPRSCAGPTRASPTRRPSKYLKELGITAIELMPVHLHVDDPFLLDKGLDNYWGYSTLSFFAPEVRYSAAARRGDSPGVIAEFKGMVKALHKEGIEVILDVVYNHTAEGNHLGPTMSFKGSTTPPITGW